MTEIVVHGISFSPYVRAVIMALEIKGVPYRVEAMELRPVPGGLHSDEHLAMHPFGRVPIIDHGNFRLYETQAILRYLDATFPNRPLQSDDPRTIGRMSQAMGVLDCYMFSQVIRPLGAERVVKPRLMGLQPDEAVAAQALAAAETSLAALDRILGDSPFLAGDELTMADVMVAPQIHLIASVPEFRALMAGTRLPAWFERMLSHPSMAATPPPAELGLPESLRALEAA